MKRKWFGLFLSIGIACSSLSGCTQAFTTEKTIIETYADAQTLTDSQFESWLDQLVIDLCQRDYTTAHHYFTNPQDHGINLSKTKVTLGDFVPSKDDIQFNNSILDQLKRWKSDELNDQNRVIYEQLYWMYDLSQRSSDEKFTYLETIWAENGGVVSSLTDFFGEYQLYSKDDIPYLVQLIQDVPNYVEKAKEYSEKQAELGLLRMRPDMVKEACEKILENKENSPVSQDLIAEIDGLQLSEEETKTYKEDIKKALDEYYFPSFEKIIALCDALKDKTADLTGLGSLENGSEYYALLLEYYSSCQDSIQTILTNVTNRMDDLSNEYQKLIKESPEAVQEGFSLTTAFTNVSEILPFLEEHYSTLFPVVKDLEYEVKELTPEQSTSGVVAYFVVPPVDSSRPYEIRYNKKDYGDDPSSISFYNTLAHEGVPGHMYQNRFNLENFTQTAQYFLRSMGMQEGYATYAAYQANAFLELNEQAQRVWYLNENFTNLMILAMDIQINYEGYDLETFNKTWDQDLTSLYYQLAESPGIFFSYYYGNYQIEKLEEKAKNALNDKFDASAFHKALLKNGNVKFSLVEESINNYIENQSAQ